MSFLVFFFKIQPIEIDSKLINYIITSRIFKKFIKPKKNKRKYHKINEPQGKQ